MGQTLQDKTVRNRKSFDLDHEWSDKNQKVMMEIFRSIKKNYQRIVSRGQEKSIIQHFDNNCMAEM